MDLYLKDKVVIVTGSGRGIGKAIARTFAEEGAKVAVADIIEENAVKVAEEIGSLGPKTVAIPVDVSDAASTQTMVKKAEEELGPIDILVNNAAKLPSFRTFVEEKHSGQTEEHWNKVVDVCLFGVINCVSAVVEQMSERSYGKIISIASDAGKVGEPRQAVYAGAKGAIIAYTKSMAKELGRYLINVNAVCPSMTKTEQTSGMLTGDFEKRVLRAYAIRRLGDPQDTANMVVFLASDRASWITGQAVSVNGGYAMA